MTSEKKRRPEEDLPSEAYVWVFLPGQVAPVVAGRVMREGRGPTPAYTFQYGRSYRERADAIPLYLPDLPLGTGVLQPPAGRMVSGALGDGAPDAWGQRVVMDRLLARGRSAEHADDLDLLTLWLESGSDRFGALDFQHSATVYTSRRDDSATIEELQQAADRLAAGERLPDALRAAMLRGSSLGGARPKALIDEGSVPWIAKFSSTTDPYDVVKLEYVAMSLAAHAGLDVAPVRLLHIDGRDVLLVRRFDRIATARGVTRRAAVSALTLFGLDPIVAHHASYTGFAELVRHRFADVRVTLHELFGRMVFNVLCSNTDDHPRNHAAFRDGARLHLTPAYDVCPQRRSGGETSHAIGLTDTDRRSRLATCLDAARAFQLTRGDAEELIVQQLHAIDTHWREVCDDAGLSPLDRAWTWGRHFLNAYAFEGLEAVAPAAARAGEEIRRRSA